jgi:SAM-dependent methyltransferase
MELAEYALMDAAEQGMWWYRALHARLVDALAGVQGCVLDAGCGTGGLLAVLRSRRPELELIGLEWHDAAARRALAKAAVPVVRGSVNALPFADAGFDAALAVDLLCHEAVRPDDALAELRRVLRPGGRLVVNMPAYAWLTSAHDRRVHNARRQSLGQLRRMLAEAGFADIRAGYWNCLLLPLMVVQRKFLARGDANSDVATFPPWLDALLHSTTQLEHQLKHRLKLGWPAGGSVLAIAERR